MKKRNHECIKEKERKSIRQNIDGSYTFMGRKCFLVDSGGRISVVWL